MENTRDTKYVSSLEKTVQNDYYFLKGTLEDFREMCSLISPDKNLPAGVVSDIRKLYKEIQNRLSEVNAIQQLLQGKYRQFHRRNPVRDKEMLEWGFMVKTLYNKLEANLKQIEEKKKRSERERIAPKGSRDGFVRWFRSAENRIVVLSNFRMLNELEYQGSPLSGTEERREVLQTAIRSFTFFLYTGDEASLDRLHAAIRLREHDIVERYGPDEVHGVLTHLREIEPGEVAKVLDRFRTSAGLPSLKCLFFFAHSQDDLEGELWPVVRKELDAMEPGEIRTLSVKTLQSQSLALRSEP
jgi:hypothetical protein